MITGSSRRRGQAEDAFGSSCLTPQTAPTIRRLAGLEPSTLAIMHGSSFTGDGGTILRALADDMENRFGRPVLAA